MTEYKNIVYFFYAESEDELSWFRVLKNHIFDLSLVHNLKW